MKVKAYMVLSGRAYSKQPLNKGHFGTAQFVLCKEVVLFGRSKMCWNYREEVVRDCESCPLQRFIILCPYLGESTIRSYTVVSEQVH